jgi:hypothetical protein
MAWLVGSAAIATQTKQLPLFIPVGGEFEAKRRSAQACQPDLTSILRGFASSAFGSTSLITPSRISALILS